MSVSGIMPHRIALLMTSLLLVGIIAWEFLKKLVTRWLMSVRTISVSGKIFLTAMMIRRRHGQAGYQTGPKGGRACRGTVPEPAPGAGDRPCPARKLDLAGDLQVFRRHAACVYSLIRP